MYTYIHSPMCTDRRMRSKCVHISVHIHIHTYVYIYIRKLQVVFGRAFPCINCLCSCPYKCMCLRK